MVLKSLDEGISASDILNKGLLVGMDIIGEKFKNNQIYIPEVLIAARAMKAGASELKPFLTEDDSDNKGTVVIGTCKGDLHDIGKNLVVMMMEGKGLKVVDLGVDVSAEDFVNAAIENDADIIACSALLTTTMVEMENVVKLSTEKGIRDKIKIMVGGAPVNQQFTDQIGADFYTADAASAAITAFEVCK